MTKEKVFRDALISMMEAYEPISHYGIHDEWAHSTNEEWDARCERACDQAREALALPDEPSKPQCPKCGLTDVSFERTCHNSACSEYAREVTFYEGWSSENRTSPL